MSGIMLINVPAYKNTYGRQIAAATRVASKPKPTNSPKATNLFRTLKSEQARNRAYTLKLALQDLLEHERTRQNLKRRVHKAKINHEGISKGRGLTNRTTTYTKQLSDAARRVQNAERALSKHKKKRAFVPQRMIWENKIQLPPISKPQYNEKGGARTLANAQALENWYKQLPPLERGRLIDTFNIRNYATRASMASRQASKKRTGSAPGRFAEFAPQLKEAGRLYNRETRKFIHDNKFNTWKFIHDNKFNTKTN